MSSVPASTGHVGTRRDSRWDTILSWMGHHFGSMGHQMGHQSAKVGHKGTPTDTISTSPALWSKRRLEEGVLRGFRALSGRKIRSGWQKRTRRRFAFFACCGILLPTSFQPSKGGDMVCARGPLGAQMSPFSIMWAIKRDRFRYSNRSLSAIAEKH